jgi:DNA polymerase III epsilon subunit-like protein
MLLFFDTETTGIPRDYRAPASDLANWPRLVQIAWLEVDEDGRELAGAEHVIRPDGFVIPPAAAAIHGITTERALAEGVSLADVLDALAPRILAADTLFAHNIAFDEKIVGAELLRAGRDNVIEARPRRCTMLESTRYCALPGRYGPKWPTLAELHHKLFGEGFDGAHRALADVRATARCYAELKRLRVMR